MNAINGGAYKKMATLYWIYSHHIQLYRRFSFYFDCSVVYSTVGCIQLGRFHPDVLRFYLLLFFLRISLRIHSLFNNKIRNIAHELGLTYFIFLLKTAQVGSHLHRRHCNWINWIFKFNPSNNKNNSSSSRTWMRHASHKLRISNRTPRK